MTYVFYLYALLDPNTFEIRYIGCTSRTLSNRLSQHLSEAKREFKNKRATWIRSLKDKPIIKALAIVPRSIIHQVERSAIKVYRDSGCDLLNETTGGPGCPGVILSPLHRQRLRDANLGKRPSDKTRQKLRIAATGRRLSNAAKELCRLATTGRKKTPETIIKMRIAAKNRMINMANRMKEKGDRFERAIVKLFKFAGFNAQRVPLSGAAGGRYDGDIECEWFDGEKLKIECKVRAHGFKKIYEWLEGKSGLFITGDRSPTLVIIRGSDFFDLMRRAHGLSETQGRRKVQGGAD